MIHWKQQDGISNIDIAKLGKATQKKLIIIHLLYQNIYNCCYKPVRDTTQKKETEN